MLQLRLLGVFQIIGSDGRAVDRLMSRSRRTAVLAYLAAAVPRSFHRRDKVLAMFWPESDEPHARAALNQTLYVLRSELGEHVVITRGDEVGLNGDEVRCDALEFEAAIESGDPARALALYRGDLLDGFHVAEAPEFERWVERERTRFRRRAADAAWTVSESSAARGDIVEATRWARQASDFFPLEEPVVRRLMTFLHHHGDRAAAIQVYEDFVSTLRHEYELEPSAETSSLANAIRTEQQLPSAVVSSVSRSGGRAGLSTHVEQPPQATQTPQTAPIRETGPRPARTVRTYALAALAAVSLAAFALFTRGPGKLSPRAEPRLAVLTFDNLGGSGDRYFADQMTDEVISRLSVMNGLVVISRTSTAHYVRDSMSLRHIAAELDADYVLEGGVRSDRSGKGNAEIRVTPRLIRVRDEALIWSDRYTATMLPGEIFRVQADIAERVASALDITLWEHERRSLRARPTNVPYAYDHYLRGQQFSAAGFSEQDTRRAQEMYERAVAADTGFALAFARLSQMHAMAYWFFYDRSAERIAMAKRAADRAVALDSSLPEAHLALGYYHYWGQLAHDDALREFRKAQSLGLNTAELFKSLGNVERRQGRLDDAIVNFESAFARDPRDIHVTFNLAQAFALRRATAEAEYYFDRAILLNPQSAPSYWNKARMYLNAARTTEARGALSAPGVPSSDSVILYHAALVEFLERRHQRALERLESASIAIENQWHFVPRAQLQAMAHAARGDQLRSRAYYDSARMTVQRRLRAEPTEANLHSALAIAYAGLGWKPEAITAARKAVELLPVTADAVRGLYRLEDLARVYAMVGERDAAVSELERLVALPGGRAIPFLELDPAWDALRQDPRFAALLKRPV